jgi:FkbM family methyltransferase
MYKQVREKISEMMSIGGLRLVLKKSYCKAENLWRSFRKEKGMVQIKLNGKEYIIDECHAMPKVRWKRFERGVVMPEVQRVMDEKLEKGDTFLDIGAMTGDTTFYAHSIIGDEGEIHSIEADPFWIPILISNIENNKLENVTIGKFAVGKKNTTMSAKKAVGGGSEKLENSQKHTQNIGVTKLDDYVSNEGIKPNLIKIDVDGKEKNVIEGGEEVIKEFPTVIEIHREFEVEGRDNLLKDIFQFSEEVIFLGMQGLGDNNLRYGDTIKRPSRITAENVVNILSL